MPEPPATDDGVTRALEAFLRAEFQAPVARLRGLIDILIEDAEQAGLTAYAEDLDRMRNAGSRLHDLVSSLLQGTALPASGAKLRHDLRTPVTAIVGYGELVAEDARDRGDAQLLEPLADILEAAARLLKELDRLVAVSRSIASVGAGKPRGVLPDVLVNAVAIAQRLNRHEPVAMRTVTGHILVVDDNAAMRDLVSRRLVREGHTVEVCNSGIKALELARRESFDLILLDLMMPGLNGFDVLDRLHAQPSTRGIPVIVISALDETETAVRCIEAGADDFISKPINETLLRARISASLDRKYLIDREQDALRQLQEEQERSEQLLRNVLPDSALERLRAGETTVADHFDDVTVLFCDLVGFTALSERLPPAQLLDLLNGIFSGFDRLTEENGLEKIKTIGDAYMVVGGMSEPVADHALRVVRMALGMPAIAAKAGHALEVRIGIDRGPAVGGIIGQHKFFYDVWGDTVNFASRLEATSESGRIHVSNAVMEAIRPKIACEARPPTEIKGKGLVQTFYLAREA